MATQRFTRTTTIAIFALLAAIAIPAVAEDPFPTNLDTTNAREFLGKWTLSADIGGREINFALSVVDLEGKLGATLDSENQPEPKAIDAMELDEDGKLILDYELSFGSQSFKLKINAALAGEGLEGTLIESSGLFEGAFTAVVATDEGDDPEAGEQRSRNRRGAASQARMRLSDGSQLRVSFGPLKADSDDHGRLADLGSGEVFGYVGGRATKLFTDVDMVFPEATVKTENAAPDYPGVYSLWLKKTDGGWNLVFNEEADIWGTMHNAEADSAEVALVAGKLDEPAETFKVELTKTDSGGELKIMWGEDVWTAAFKLEAA